MKKLILLSAFLFPLVSTAQEQHVMPEGLKGVNQMVPMICADDARDMYNALKKTHGEEPVILGFSSSGPVAVVWFTDPDKSTLSIVVDAPDKSCMIFSTRCLPGDCFVPAEENYEREKGKMLPENNSPKVSL
jgi:hypothetical protein